ncbi:MAG TPA: peptidase C14 [Deltaproteobacteria bacterium]|nr:peptidase C14 [Deltaproteobacteria bacterium]
MIAAAKKGDVATMQRLLDQGADINEGALSGNCSGPPLAHAAYYCKPESVRYLVGKGADIEAVGVMMGGNRPLHLAAREDCVEAVKILLDAGADINAQSLYGSALAWAARNGNIKTVKYLIERGADVDDAMTTLRKSGYDDGVTLLEKYDESKALYEVGIKKSVVAIKSEIEEVPEIEIKPNKNAYAIVIGVEKYRQNLPNADFAVADAQTIRKYLTKIMGYPEENVISLTNEYSTKSDFEKYFERWLPNNSEKGSTVFVYFSGHGAPNPRTGDAYLVPYDGDPSFIDQTGYSLKRMYNVLGKLKAKEIIVVLDSCFSGAGGRSVIAKGARPLVMNLQNNIVFSKNITVLSASSGDQVSSTYDEKGHGLFTYFLLKGIKNEDVVNPDGSLAIYDLFSYIKPQVEHIARKQYNNEQTPQLIRSSDR